MRHKPVYLLAVNWRQVNEQSQADVARVVRKVDVWDGTDIAYCLDRLRYRQGWRVYVYLSRRARDKQARLHTKAIIKQRSEA